MNRRQRRATARKQKTLQQGQLDTAAIRKSDLKSDNMLDLWNDSENILYRLYDRWKKLPDHPGEVSLQLCVRQLIGLTRCLIAADFETCLNGIDAVYGNIKRYIYLMQQLETGKATLKGEGDEPNDNSNEGRMAGLAHESGQDISESGPGDNGGE